MIDGTVMGKAIVFATLPWLLSGCALLKIVAPREHRPEGFHALDAWYATHSSRQLWPPAVISPSDDEAAQYEASLRDRVAEYLRTHPSLPEHQRAALQDLYVREGVTTEQVRLLWGPPRQKISQPGRYGATEMWSYEFLYANLEHEYQLFFKDDLLIRIDDVYVESL